ncbi:MAG: isochorismatase family cysteine hydrolase [Candidatus Diapherotrites archaeon]
MQKKEAAIKWKSYGKAALLIIDVQKGAIETYSKHKRITPKIKKIADCFRELKFPVIHTLYVKPKTKRRWTPVDRILNRKEFLQGSKSAEEVDGLKKKSDFIIKKKHFSAFYKTNLEKLLKKKKVKTLVITGLLTHWCVYMTALDALQRNYQVVIVKDAVSSHREKIHELLMRQTFKNSVGEIINSEAIIKKMKRA